jgi:RNA polymerase sigma-70 factor (ECF subfamily)
VAIWEKHENFDFEKPAKSYLYTAVYNRCMNHIRDNKGQAMENNLELADNNPENSINTDHLEAAELESRIWKVIDTLPEKCKEIFLLNRFENQKYSEIAEQLNISAKTVEAQMSKALAVLRDGLKDYIHLFIFFIIKNLW